MYNLGVPPVWKTYIMIKGTQSLKPAHSRPYIYLNNKHWQQGGVFQSGCTVYNLEFMYNLGVKESLRERTLYMTQTACR